MPANGRLSHLLTSSFLLGPTLHLICCPGVECTSDWVQGTATLLTVSTQLQRCSSVPVRWLWMSVTLNDL